MAVQTGPIASAYSPEITDGSKGKTVIVLRESWLFRRVLTLLLIVSVIANVVMYASYRQYFAATDGPNEAFRSGNVSASNKIAVIRVSGTIMPPFTSRILQDIRSAKNDPAVKGVLLVVNSPGGFVADSHQIYHRLLELRQTKPIYVQMESLAASGGLYVAMAAGESGKIFAEPTTWTGSIGVIIPHYEVHELAKMYGVKSEPLKTGTMKDALSPFKPLSDEERLVWEKIMNQSFDEFLKIIDENRSKLDIDGVRKLATGQIYTARDAVENGLVDEIGYEESAIAALQAAVGLTDARVIEYQHTVTALDLLLAKSQSSNSGRQEVSATYAALLESTVPRALYLCSWLPPLPN